MNLLSFADELVKVGGFSNVVKMASQAHESIPGGMASGESVPEAIPVHPDQAATRIPKTSHLPSIVESGNMGDVSDAKDPIDRSRYNRAYGDRR